MSECNRVRYPSKKSKIKADARRAVANVPKAIIATISDGFEMTMETKETDKICHFRSRKVSYCKGQG